MPYGVCIYAFVSGKNSPGSSSTAVLVGQTGGTRIELSDTISRSQSANAGVYFRAWFLARMLDRDTRLHPKRVRCFRGYARYLKLKP